MMDPIGLRRERQLCIASRALRLAWSQGIDAVLGVGRLVTYFGRGGGESVSLPGNVTNPYFFDV